MAEDPIHDVPDGLARLIAVMQRLRDPETGCPWDIEQDFRTIAPYTIEEAYEVADAIDREAWGDLEGELGDLLLQVVYHGQMGAEAGHFDNDPGAGIAFQIAIEDAVGLRSQEQAILTEIEARL